MKTEKEKQRIQEKIQKLKDEMTASLTKKKNNQKEKPIAIILYEIYKLEQELNS